MTVLVFIKAVLIALIAAAMAWLPVGIMFTAEMGPENVVTGLTGPLFGFAMLGSFAVGLPVALLVFWLAGGQLAQNPSILAMVIALSCVMLLLASFVIGGVPVMFLYGLPCVLAALTYGVLGWLWILKPMRKDRNA